MKYSLLNFVFVTNLIIANANATDSKMAIKDKSQSNMNVMATVEKSAAAPDDPHSYYSKSPLNVENSHMDSMSSSMSKGKSSSLSSFKSDTK